MKFIQFNDGSFLRLDIIMAVRIADGNDTFPPRVLVDYVNGACGSTNFLVLNFGTLKDCQLYVIRIMEIINQAWK